MPAVTPECTDATTTGVGGTIAAMAWDFHVFDPHSNPGSNNLDQVSGQLEATTHAEAEDAACAEFEAVYGRHDRQALQVEVSPSLPSR